MDKNRENLRVKIIESLGISYLYESQKYEPHLPKLDRKQKKEFTPTKKMKDASEEESENLYEIATTTSTDTSEFKKGIITQKNNDLTNNRPIQITLNREKLIVQDFADQKQITVQSFIDQENIHVQSFIDQEKNNIQNFIQNKESLTKEGFIDKEEINRESFIEKESQIVSNVQLEQSENKDSGQLQGDEDKNSGNNKDLLGPAVVNNNEKQEKEIEEEKDSENLFIREEESEDDLAVPTRKEIVDSSCTDLKEQQLNEDEPIVPRSHLDDVNASESGDEVHDNCQHHDMADNVYGLKKENSDSTKSHVREPQCSHSDAVKLGKPVKVNRVSPFRYGDVESGNLLIDLTDSELEDYKRHKLKLHSDYSLALKTKNSIDDEENTRRVEVNGGYTTDDLKVTQERFSTDLPRHNWLEKRIKQQNQLNEGDIISLHATNSVNSDVNKKEIKKSTDMRTNGGLETISQSQMMGKPATPLEHATKISDTDEQMKTLSPQSIKKDNSSPSIKDVMESEVRSPTVKSVDHESSSQFPSPKSNTNGPPTPCSPFINNYTSSSLASALSPTKSISVADLKPKLIMSTSQQSMTSPKGYSSSLPGIDLSTLKYDTLSKFNASPKAPQTQPPAFYPTISSAYSLAPYEGRNVREVARPMPLHAKENYKSEQDAFGMNHRVRLSFTPLSSTKEKSSAYINQNIDKSASMIKNYDTFPVGVHNATSPEELKRTAAIQRQLENQKRWIAEHEPYKVGTKYVERNEARPNPQATSPLNPTNLPPGARYPTRPQSDDVYNNPEHVSLLQSREHLREKIDACNKEIKNIQQQKDVLFARQQGIPNTDSPTHLRIIALNRKLSSLEDYRMKQSALLMKLEAQPFESLITPRDHRPPITVRKPNYPDGINGSLTDNDDLVVAKRMNFPSDQSENLLLRQLQSKHDEGASMVMTDSHCRTIDLSKSSEIFYNDMRGEGHPSMSQPSTPMSNPALSGDIPPLVSAERLPPNGLSQEKTPDFPHRGPPQTPYSKSPEIPRPITHSAHELANSIQREMARDQSRYSQYERIARARELQHSLQLQDTGRPPSTHEMAQLQERLVLRGPRPEMNGRPDHPLEPSKTRDLNYAHHIQHSESQYSPGGTIPHSQPFPEGPPSYEEIRAKEMSLKRHSSDPIRPGQLKLARTVSSMSHPMHPSQMDQKYQKLHQRQSLENKYSPSSIPSSMIGGSAEEVAYKQRTRYDMVPTPNEYSNESRLPTYPSVQQTEKQKIRVRTCNACDKKSQFLCSGCRGIWYCSRECQLDDWKVHSKNCRKK